MSDRNVLGIDWEAMTTTDWVGLAILLAVSALMVWLYFWVFRPRNKNKFEAHRDFVNREDDISREVKDGPKQ